MDEKELCSLTRQPPAHQIRVMRANYGRFSVAICNDKGVTDWSVNCMAPRSLRIMQDRWVIIEPRNHINTAFQFQLKEPVIISLSFVGAITSMNVP